MKNVLDKSYRENQNTHFMVSNFFPENLEKSGGARGAINDVTIWRIRVECWISKATRTTRAHAQAHAPGLPHTRTDKYVILIAFPQQQ